MPSKGAPNMLPNVLPHAESDHVPVLADEVRELLAVRPGETVVDATFGAGGHARLLAQDLAGRGKLVAIDRDPGAKSYFDRFKAAAGVEVRFLRGDFAVVLTQLAVERGRGGRDPARPRHLVDAGRPAGARLLVRDGRAARHADGPVVRDDRRRDRQHLGRARARDDLPALRRGALRGADRPGDRARAATSEPFTRTGELVDTIKLAIPTPARFGEGHPAKRVFQALRIAVNDELGQLEAALPAALQMLRPGGRLAVISFHSLEDRIVKRFVAEQAKGCTCPPDFPVCVCGKEPTLRCSRGSPCGPASRRPTSTRALRRHACARR